jgi:hypothetical protein
MLSNGVISTNKLKQYQQLFEETNMKQFIARTAMTAGLTLGSLGMVGVAAAAQPTAPGTPGTPNCQGQTMAYLAQSGKSLDAPGIGNLASLAGLSVKEVHDAVDSYCAAP